MTTDYVADLPGLRSDGSGTAYCGRSIGALDWAQFDPDLLARNVAQREQFEQRHPRGALHPYSCGCEDCREWRHGWMEAHLPAGALRMLRWIDSQATPFEAAAAFAGRVGAARPTPDEFAAHARGFRHKAVLETAGSYLMPGEMAVLKVAVEADERERVNGAPGRQRIAAAAKLNREGLAPVAIAERMHADELRRKFRRELRAKGLTDDDELEKQVEAKVAEQLRSAADIAGRSQREQQAKKLLASARTSVPRRRSGGRAAVAATLAERGLTTAEIGAEMGVSAEHAQRLLRSKNGRDDRRPIPGLNDRKNPCKSGGQNRGVRPSEAQLSLDAEDPLVPAGYDEVPT